ncbi:DUF4429 domain-containing protein [Streptomyces sp. NBC_01190]|uniref:DUF4429 domain-containing protein n=1 Tax=Streptomyces sp. NBC_01190 TaxID=2903767 RepID=UPI003867F39F|nr:DUF4429 domain-containing protein [Streptomyces sp. NBC_01190]
MDTIDVKGAGGRVVFDGEHLTIIRGGGLGRWGSEAVERRLHVSEIVAIGWQPAGLARGSIRFETEHTRGLARMGRDAAKTAAAENAVAFRAGQQPHFAELKVAVERAVSAARGDALPAQDAADTAEEIARLSHLVQTGAITQEEFRQSKARLLGRG